MRFDLDMPAWKWPFYVARHPFEGFEDLQHRAAPGSDCYPVLHMGNR